jgi:hypothetical protein
MTANLVLLGLAAAAVAAPSASVTPNIHIQADQTRIGMGRTLAVRAVAMQPDGRPAAGRLLLPYVNGKRWGAHEYADANGAATFRFPLPCPGRADVQVTAESVISRPTEEWIWTKQVSDGQHLFLQTAFDAPPGVTQATLWMAVDDFADVYLNGEKVHSAGGWTAVKPVEGLARHLRPGRNVLSVAAVNGTGPAGLLVRLEWQTKTQSGLCVTNPSWHAYDTPPDGWPGFAANPGVTLVSFGKADQALWSGGMANWPTIGNRDKLMAGSPLPPGAVVSNTVPVEVYRRPIRAIPSDPQRLVGMQWEPWFTPNNAAWQTAQAVPVMGFYWSWNPEVTRQHILWFAESGIDFLVVDWTNHLWDKKHWDERPDGTNEIILCTTLALETLASMRDEGIPVPKMVLLTGLCNGPSTTMEALNEEHAWIYHNYIRNPRFKDLFVEYDGKPLLMPFCGGGPNWLKNAGGPPIDDTHFTMRWNSAQHQISHDNEAGFWSWMDGSLRQPVTYRDGKPEALTVSCGFFAGGGWLAPDAYGHRNGWTYVESFRQALELHPRVIQLHQFQEYAGQPEGQGYGPNHDIYVDSYSAELSDDIEPTSLTAPAYRGEGGWGFLSLNLTRALVDLYRQRTPETTVVAIGSPLRASTVTGDRLNVEWTALGHKPTSFTVLLNGRTVARGLQETHATIDLRDVKSGPVTLRVVAEGTKMRYLPSWTEDSLPLEHSTTAYAELSFTRKR